MRFIRWVLIMMTVFGLSACSLIKPNVITSGHIPPTLTQARVVYGCGDIANQMELANCYLKSREALYLANQDKKSLRSLEKEWNY